MEIIALGINHMTAPVEIREKIVFTENQLEGALTDLLQESFLKECVVLSTCNRTEIYAVTPDPGEGREAVMSSIRKLKCIDRDALQGCIYFYRSGEAVEHLLRVAAGLDSMILGETQILGQVKNAYEQADACNAVGKILHSLFRQALICGKRVHSETKINENAASVSYAAVELAKNIFGRLVNRSILLISAGKMSELTLRHLYAQGASEVMVTNRTRERAEEIACSYGGKAWDYARIEEGIGKVDIVITSTGAPHFIINRLQMARIMRARKNRPLFIIDIAVPRDIEPAVNDLPNVYLYDIDDLQGVVDSNMKSREREAGRAGLIIAEEAAEFQTWFKTLDVVPLIAALRKKAEAIRKEELQRHLSSRLGKLDAKEQKAVDNLTRSIINRILRDPVLRIKEFAIEERSEVYVDSLCRLFELEDELYAEETPDSVPHAVADKKAGRKVF